MLQPKAERGSVRGCGRARPAQLRSLASQRREADLAQFALGRAMNLHPHGMNRAGFPKRAGARIEDTGTRRHPRLGDVDDVKEREMGWISRQHEAAVHTAGGRYQSRAHQLLQNLRDKEIRRRGRLRDLALGCQTVPRAGQVDEAANGVVDLSKEVHGGPIMQQGRRADEQLLDAPFDLVFDWSQVASPTTTTRQMPPSGRQDAAVNPETVRNRTAFG